MRFFAACILILGCLAAGEGHAQFGVAWRQVPTVAVVGKPDDPRLVLVDEAIAFWNNTLQEIGAAFRLSPATRITQPVADDALQSLSRAVVGGSRGPVYIPQALRNLPADITIMLGTDFVSFAGPFDAESKRLVGIRGANLPPLNLPNVARNVITHELGHAIGLGHNADASKLMCGRPASCRPALFQSAEPRMFPLTDDERRQLLNMYPPDWKPQRDKP